MQLIDLMKILVEKGGSDLHIMAGLPPAMRFHGTLVPMTEFERFTPQTAKEFIYSILSEEQKHSFEKDPETRGELDFALGISGLGRFRCNVHLQRGTIAAAFRALSRDIPKLEDLGFPESIRTFTRAKKGLVLVTGPTGCGKSTTLASMIDIINSERSDHIITIEDPIEYLHNSKKSYVTQREVGLTADTLSFKNALKYALRQDPDVILVGEMRDYETIGVALTSAETGHLVFATLHTAGAAKTVSRIIDVFPAEQQPQIRTQLASNLVGVISQVLLPRQDQDGRIMACEIMFANSAIRNNIRTGKLEAIYQTIQTSMSEGMMSMDQSLGNLIRAGKICSESAAPYIYDKVTLQNLKQPTNSGDRAPQNTSLSVKRETPPWELRKS